MTALDGMPIGLFRTLLLSLNTVSKHEQPCARQFWKPLVLSVFHDSSMVGIPRIFCGADVPNGSAIAAAIVGTEAGISPKRQEQATAPSRIP